MKGTYPKPVYILMALLGIVLLVLPAVLDLDPVIADAVGAGLFAYGLTRLVGEWRVTHDPEYAKKLETANQDERLAYIADKARSMTLILTVLILGALGIILLALGQKSYGNSCIFIMAGISLLYFIVYQVFSRKY